MSEITDSLDQLAAGDLDLDALAEAFRSHPWPRRTRTEVHDDTDLYAQDSADPVEDPQGSFSEVAAYWAMHRIDEETYRVLAEAAATAMQDAPPPGTPAGAVNERTST